MAPGLVGVCDDHCTRRCSSASTRFPSGCWVRVYLPFGDRSDWPALSRAPGLSSAGTAWDAVSRPLPVATSPTNSDGLAPPDGPVCCAAAGAGDGVPSPEPNIHTAPT